MQAFLDLNKDSRWMEAIKSKLDIVGESVPPGAHIVYLDYPVHGNIGDLLIMKGTEAYFKAKGIRVRKRFSYLNFRMGTRIPSSWIIVCHGGGNFGDLYPYYQKFRETLVQRYPRHRIVILPQTIYFRDPEEQRRSLKLFGRHADLHLYVRDEGSYRAAKSEIANVTLAPDMAHELYPLKAAPPGSGKRLALVRTDGEGNSWDLERSLVLSCDTRTDWPDLFGAWDRLLLGIVVRAHSLDRRCYNLLPIRRLWYFLSDLYVRRAVRLFDSYDHILTSRLHGHILSCLMGKPNRLMDNSYGKNSSYYRQWIYRLEEACDVGNSGNHAGDLHSQSS
ncbi:polysaccharide pyruvyl transferase family protein [Cohnella soli]|uniref:Polysaccharide pyruvyl transferase family protein n=1 Tax=Cohnella soli TaxID=425005 RepID=A0ABW0HV97_9BACL